MEIVKKTQKNSEKPKIAGIMEKIKNIKHIEVIIAICLIVAVIGIYLSGTEKNTKTNTEEKTVSQNNTDVYEEKLKAVLSEINGAGKVDVMITYNSSSEIITPNTTKI